MKVTPRHHANTYRQVQQCSKDDITFGDIVKGFPGYLKHVGKSVTGQYEAPRFSPVTKLEQLHADIRGIMNDTHEHLFTQKDRKHVVNDFNWHTEAGAERALAWVKQKAGVK